MSEQPLWKESITVNELVLMIEQVFREKYDREMTKRARSALRSSLTSEILTLGEDLSYETGMSSANETAEKFADLAAGQLQLKHSDEVTPRPTDSSLERYTRVGVSATLQTIEKAKAYHKKTKVCPVWPFCH